MSDAGQPDWKDIKRRIQRNNGSDGFWSTGSKNLITHRLFLTVEDTDDIFRKIADGEDVIKAAYILNK